MKNGIANLTQHAATEDQKAAGVADLPDAAELEILLTSEEPPAAEEIVRRAGAKGVHTMTRTTTKDEEMKALRTIRDIVEGLGSDSYLAISTEGFWSMAETNILDDIGNSVAQYRKCWEATSSENRELEKKIKELQDKNAKLEEAIKSENRELEKKIKELQDKNAKLEEAIKDAELARKDILDHKFKEVQGLQEQIMEMSEGYRQSRHEVCELKKKTRPKSAK